MLSIIALGYYLDNKKNKDNAKNVYMLERAIKDLIEEFRTLELLFTDQKKVIEDYKYTLEKIDLEIARLADSSSGESKITMAIQMANQGKTISEISEATNLSAEEVEPIIKFHGKG
jgi:DNA-binding Lrp family transcriptional regulator